LKLFLSASKLLLMGRAGITWERGCEGGYPLNRRALNLMMEVLNITTWEE
jgi:hypothetical protein